MRIDVVRAFVTQKLQQPANPIYINSSLEKQNAKMQLLKNLNEAPEGVNPYIDFELSLSEASVNGAKQFSEAERTHLTWVADSVSQLGTILIGNFMDLYV